MNPYYIEHITLAERAGLGTNNSDSITVVGTTIAATKRVFRKGQTNSSWFGQSNRIWLMNGPYSTTGIPSPMSYEFVANEDSVAPVAGVGGWSQPVYFTNDQIMLKDYFGLGTQSAVSYAFTYFNAPATQTAELWVGSDEALKIYINGQVAYNYSGSRIFAGTSYWSEVVTINVNQGLNTLLVKAYQGTGSSNYNFSLNICEVQSDTYYKGNRILGLKFKTTGAPPVVPPAAPQNLSGVPGNEQVTLRWKKNSETNITKYRIYHSLSSPASTLFDSTSSVTDTVKIITGLTNGIAHYFRVTAVNNTSLESEFSNEVSATPSLPSGIDIDISQGWNLVSVPLIQSDYTASVVFPGALGVLFKYDQVLGDYVEAPILDLGLGVWVYYTTATTVTISGAAPGPITIACKHGWNLIGSRETEVQVANLQLSTGSILGVAFKYDPSIGDYAETAVIPPGGGIWIYVTVDCTITIPSE
jgi:hypothetical protein